MVLAAPPTFLLIAAKKISEDTFLSAARSDTSSAVTPIVGEPLVDQDTPAGDLVEGVIHRPTEVCTPLRMSPNSPRSVPAMAAASAVIVRYW